MIGERFEEVFILQRIRLTRLLDLAEQPPAIHELEGLELLEHRGSRVAHSICAMVLALQC